jgi:RNA polymerase sigma-70 factor (ECF subfamily)
MAKHTCLETFELNVLPHLDAAYNLAYWLIGNRQDAENIVQEAYLLAFSFFPNFRGRDTRAWLMRIVRDSCDACLYVNRSLPDAAEAEESPFRVVSQAPEPQEVALQNVSGTVLRGALQKLSPNVREVLILRELEGMSYSEIADTTGRPAGTVVSSLARARGRLRQALTDLMSVQRQISNDRDDAAGESA